MLINEYLLIDLYVCVCVCVCQAEYVKRLGLAGAFIWSLDMDDFSGACGAGRYPLLSAVSRSLWPDSHSPPPLTALSYDHLISRQV